MTTIKRHRTVITPNGRGVVTDRLTGNGYVVCHGKNDLNEKAKELFWKGGPCVFLTYPAKDVQEVDE